MPVLKNARHELFAQEIAKGKTATEAYTIAGYKDNRSNAATLARTSEIRDRVTQITTKVANKTIRTAETYANRLLEVAERAIDRDQLGAATSALMGAAKIEGHITDKQRIESDIAPDRAVLERAVIDAMAANTAPVAPKPTNSDGETLQ